ncbi:Hypothetical predicted protein [Marmota monax]|uniref:Uncharacterized protein n=1 Tax=Marmota monax TaxID=9995 RepID=A0A5E4C0C5_MARMO|nr:Hypothetical predicted protein [Marmota monax]
MCLVAMKKRRATIWKGSPEVRKKAQVEAASAHGALWASQCGQAWGQVLHSHCPERAILHEDGHEQAQMAEARRGAQQVREVRVLLPGIVEAFTEESPVVLGFKDWWEEDAFHP